MRGVEIRPLTGLRGAAATWVVFFHVHAGRPERFHDTLPWVQDWVHPLLGHGHLSLDLFFVLSGFVIALNYMETVGRDPSPKTLRRFWWARLARVWPAFFVMTSVAALVDIFVSVLRSRPMPDGLTPISYLEQLLMVHLWTSPGHAGTSWNGPGWSLSAEWLAYLLFPLLAVVFAWFTRVGSARVLATLAMASLAPLALVMINSGSFMSPYSWVLKIMCQFVAGMLMYAAVAKVEWTPVRRRAAGWGCALLVGAVVAWLYATSDAPLASTWGLAFVLFPPLVGLLSVASGPVAGALSRPSMLFTGRISYSVYLAHVPVFDLLMALSRKVGYFRANPELFVYFSLAIVPVAYLSGWLLWRYVEEPCRRRMRAMVGSPGSPSVPATSAQPGLRRDSQVSAAT